MRIGELKTKSREELLSLLEEKRSRVDEFRFLLHEKKVKNVKEVGQIKNDIARILTLLKNHA